MNTNRLSERSRATNTRRALLIAGVVSAGAFSLFIPGIALSASGIDQLDDPSITVKSLNSVMMIALARAGNRMVVAGQHGVIAYSDDNGVSWTQAKVPVSATLTCLGFATPMLGWAAGHYGIVLITEDGGLNWRVQLNGLQVNELTLEAASNPTTAVSVSPGAPRAIERANFFVQSGPSKPFLSILVLGPEKVMVFGAYRMTVVTLDGGKSWADWSLHIYDKLSHNLYDAACIGASIYVVGEQGGVFCSTDGGATFPSLPPPSAVTLYGIIGMQNGGLLVFGVAGACFHSSDKGQTWTPLNLPVEDNLVAGITLRSGVVVIASEAGALLASQDHGSTFKLVPGMPSTAIYDIEESSGADLIVAGDGGIRIIPAAEFKS